MIDKRDLYFAAIMGWKHGASAQAMDLKFTQHEDEKYKEAYNKAYELGYEDRKKRFEEFSKEFGYTPTILRAI